MAEVDNTVFISYRRSNSSFIARAIFEDLRKNDLDVFMDVESINAGEFETIILNQIAARAHFVLLLTPGSVERCAEPDDWLRREIETAMSLGRNIVPVLANGFTFSGTEPYLTGQLSVLPRYNSLHIYHEYFDEAMERLRTRFLAQPIDGPIVPTPEGEKDVVRRKIMKTVAVAPSTTEMLVSPEIHVARAIMRQRNGDLENAMKEFEKAIRLREDYLEAYVGRASLYRLMNDMHRSMQDYNKAVRLNPREAAIYNGRGQIYFAMELYGQALADFQKAHELKPGEMNLLAGLAITHHALGQSDGARKLWKLLMASDRNFQDTAWVQEKFDWPDALVEEAKAILSKL